MRGFVYIHNKYQIFFYAENLSTLMDLNQLKYVDEITNWVLINFRNMIPFMTKQT